MLPVYETKQFDHNERTKEFIGELSDTPLGKFPNSDDLGLILKSGKTGHLASWYVSREEFDKAEGELLYVVLRPTLAAVESHPSLEGYKMELFND